MNKKLQAENKTVLNVIKDLIKDNRICVLSTIHRDRPYCSLMRYTCDRNCREIYLITHRNTTKYLNLMANPNVSLLIDSRAKQAIAQIQALTIEGRLISFADVPGKKDIRNQFIERHPDITAFVNHPDAEPLRIEIQSFLLLNGLEDAHHIRVGK